MLAIEETRLLSRAEIITGWYKKVFPLVASYVKRNGGDLESAREIFQDTIVLYYEKLRSSDFKPEKNDEAYLLGIAKKQWLKHCTKTFSYGSLENIELTEENAPVLLAQKLMHYLKQAGEKCMDILQAFYYEQQSMKQIAHQFGYTNERSATVQKFKCLEKVRNQVKRKSLSYEDFLD